MIELSSVEAYILIAAALLHDAGMVCSQADKAAILESVDWSQWIAASTSRQEQLAALKDFREGGSPANPQVRDLLADYGLRQMIAEYVRRTHHTRIVPMLEEHEDSFAGFAFGDASLLQTIAAVCESHGLPSSELDDSRRFPDRRAVRDEEVNVRLMALLLRIADLLDVSPERACPLVQRAAAPLPEDTTAGVGATPPQRGRDKYLDSGDGRCSANGREQGSPRIERDLMGEWLPRRAPDHSSTRSLEHQSRIEHRVVYAGRERHARLAEAEMTPTAARLCRASERSSGLPRIARSSCTRVYGSRLSRASSRLTTSTSHRATAPGQFTAVAGANPWHYRD